MLEFLKKKIIKQEGEVLFSVVSGEEIPVQETKDPTFAEELLGKAIAVIPDGNTLYAPCDAVVGNVFETKHAVTLTTKEGAEILLHIGIDTVSMKGEGFSSFVNDGDTVKKGQKLIVFDQEKIKAAGYDTTVFMIVCNSDDYKEITKIDQKEVTKEEKVMKLLR